MKIGILIYSLGGGGAERVAVNLANEFVEQGNEVSLILFECTSIAYEINKNVNIYFCNVKKYRNKVDKTFKRMYLIRKILTNNKIDILLAFTISMVPYALAAAWRKKCKVIGTERANPKMHKKLYQFVIKHISIYCDGFIFQTNGAKKYYSKQIQDKSIVISNPVYNRGFEWKKNMGMKLCSAGRLHEDKDFPTLIAAFALLHKQYPDSSLTIFGEGELKDMLKNIVCELGVESAVVFNGFTKNLQEQMAEYSLFVFSSKAEGMPNALMEAMAIGMPCISTDCEFGPSELIEQGINGLLVETGNKEKMAEAMLWMVEHQTEREKMGRKAMEICDNNQIDKISKIYLDYIKNLKK